jgi:hypothetical protein
VVVVIATDGCCTGDEGVGPIWTGTLRNIAIIVKGTDKSSSRRRCCWTMMFDDTFELIGRSQRH